MSAAGKNLTFQWQRNGLALPGATSPTHAIPAAAPADMGFYSVVVRGELGTVESATAILAVASGGSSRLINLSARGHISTNGALTPGFTWRGPEPKNLLIRAVGPGLAFFGVTETLPDPRLIVHATGLNAPIARNYGWDNSADITAASIAAGAFALASGSRDAALVLTLPPGGYTFTATSASDTTGMVLVEIYDLDP